MSQTFDIQEWNDFALWGFLMASYGVALLTAIITHQSFRNSPLWYAQLRKPSWTPSHAVFALIWFIVYFIVAFAGYRGNKLAPTLGYRRGLNALFAIQLFLVLLWALVFFGAKDIVTAFYLVILLAVVVLIWILVIWNVDRLSAYLLILYLIWLIFLIILNYYFVINNRVCV